LERIQKVILERGYVPNQQARNLQKGRSFTLGMALRLYSDQDFTSAFLSQTLKGLHQASREAGYGIRLQTESTAQTLESFYRSKAIDGLIYMSYRPDSDREVFAELKKNNRAFVLFGTDKSFPSVDMDYPQGIHLVAEQIMQKKKSRVLFIGGELDQPFNQAKLVAFQRFMEEKGEGIAVKYAHGCWRQEHGAAAVAAAYEEGFGPDVVFAAEGDISAIGALHELHRRGRRVPEDVGLIAGEGSSYSCTTEPKLTSLYAPYDTRASLAVDLLVQILDGKSSVKNKLIPMSFQEGESF
jgi:LacI family transcriptional regulator